MPTTAFVERLERASRGITVHHRSGTEEAQVDAEAVFFAVGWPGNADTLGANGHWQIAPADETRRIER